MRVIGALAALLAVAVATAACGGSKGNGGSGQTVTGSAASSPPSTSTSTSTSGEGALRAEAASASAGDIPDNQAFLFYRNPAAGYSIKVPEGWARKGSGRRVTFQDKNNVVRIEVTPGAKPTVATVTSELKRLARQTP